MRLDLLRCVPYGISGSLLDKEGFWLDESFRIEMVLMLLSL